MSQLGCTTPHGENKNYICTEQNSSMLALDMYLNLMGAENSCLKPCSFTTTTVSVKDLLPENSQKEGNENQISKQYLHFKVFKMLRGNCYPLFGKTFTFKLHTFSKYIKMSEPWKATKDVWPKEVRQTIKFWEEVKPLLSILNLRGKRSRVHQLTIVLICKFSFYIFLKDCRNSLNKKSQGISWLSFQGFSGKWWE